MLGEGEAVKLIFSIHGEVVEKREMEEREDFLMLINYRTKSFRIFYSVIEIYWSLN
jgi:hypothetical protein